MAQNLQLLKRRIKTAKNISQIAKAMEMISASKIKKAQSEVTNNKPYAQRITDITTSLLREVDKNRFHHPFIEPSSSDKKLLIVVSPDKGLCGSLNTNLFKKLLEVQEKDEKLFTLGRKVRLFSARLNVENLGGLDLGTTIPPYSTVFKLIEIINTEYISGNVSSVELLYSQFNSVFSQEPIIKKILPIEPAVSTEEGNYSFLFEPKAEQILSDLLPYYLEVILYNSILEAYTSEQAARMMAMQNAKNNALDIADYLTLSYNKSRQERITSELLALSSL